VSVRRGGFKSWRWEGKKQITDLWDKKGKSYRATGSEREERSLAFSGRRGENDQPYREQKEKISIAREWGKKALLLKSRKGKRDRVDYYDFISGKGVAHSTELKKGKE